MGTAVPPGGDQLVAGLLEQALGFRSEGEVGQAEAEGLWAWPGSSGRGCCGGWGGQKGPLGRSRRAGLAVGRRRRS